MYIRGLIPRNWPMQFRLNCVSALFQSQHDKKLVSTIRKCHNHSLQTKPRHSEGHQEDNYSKETSFRIPMKMIAKPDRTLNTAKQNKGITQNPLKHSETMRATINNESTTNNRTTALERTADRKLGLVVQHKLCTLYQWRHHTIDAFFFD